MKRILTTIIIGIVILSIIGDAVPYVEWSKTYGGTGTDNFRYVSKTSDGGYIAVGSTYTTNVQIYLVKTGSFGNKQWSKTFGGPSHDGAYSVQQTLDGGYIFAGYTHNSYGNDDGLIIKTDSLGNMSWNKKYGGSNNDGFTSIQQTADRGYIVAGGTNSFGSGGSDGWIIKVDAYGNRLWSKTYGDSNDQKVYSVRQTTDEGYIVAGGSLDLYLSDGFVIKTDKYGNKLWQNNGADYDIGNAKSVQQTKDGGYIVGTELYWHSPVVGKGTMGNLLKIDAYGNTQWIRGSNSLLKSTQQTNDGGYISVGSTEQNCDPYYCSNAYPLKGIIIKTDSSGIEKWNKTFNIQKNDQLEYVRQTNDGGYIIAGYIKPSGINDYNAWLVKVSEVPRIIVTSPNGGENWQRGISKTITWSKLGNPGPYVKIDLYKAGVFKQTIVSSTSNDGSHSWYIPITQTLGTDYKIKITSTSNSAYSDLSNNYFRIY